jgi:hypothetical protein
MLSIAIDLPGACRYIVAHYEKFEADPNIYGDLRPQYESSMKRLNKLPVEH